MHPLTNFELSHNLSSGTLSLLRDSAGDSMTLTQQLQGLVENYFDKFPNMSMNALALKSGIGATTLRRLRSDSIKGDPAPHTVLSLVSSVTNERRLSVIVEMFDGPLGELLKQTFGPYVEQNVQHKASPSLNSFLTDATSYFIYKLAANREGTTLETIEGNYGALGLKRLSELTDHGLINEVDGVFKASEPDFCLDVHLAAGHLPQLVSHYKPDEIPNGQNLFYTMSESLNEEGIQKVKTAQKEAIKKIMDIMRSPFYAGDIPYFTLDMADTLEMPKKIGVLQ